jgi:hypothetical protein
MYQVIDELLAEHHRPVFVIIERADLLFRQLPDSGVIISQHYKSLTKSRLCIIYESREPIHALNYSSGAMKPVIFNIPEYTKQEVEGWDT